MHVERIAVVGAGVFGVTAALELRKRGYDVGLFDQGPIPHPLAASTDISKVCRMEYGADEAYMCLMEEARLGWLEWNDQWHRTERDPLYQETGVLLVCLDEMEVGGFEYDSFQLLQKRGHQPDRIGGIALTKRFPAWSHNFIDGFYHSLGGFAQSGRVIESLIQDARRLGVEIRERLTVTGLLEESRRIVGVKTAAGESFLADHVVLACGSWVSQLLPTLAPSLRRSYHPVWHLRPRQPERFVAGKFPTFTADVARTGFYGFPLHPVEEVVKIGHHGIGVDPPVDGSLEVPDHTTARLLEFLAQHLPSLADSTIVRTRLCPYCDTPDEDFWIARDPQRPGLTVASGGSGHGFKFAPVLGTIIADTVEEREHPLAEKFRWRPELKLDQGFEAARCHDDVL